MYFIKVKFKRLKNLISQTFTLYISNLIKVIFFIFFRKFLIQNISNDQMIDIPDEKLQENDIEKANEIVASEDGDGQIELSPKEIKEKENNTSDISNIQKKL